MMNLKVTVAAVWSLAVVASVSAELPAPAASFIEKNCADCHDGDAKKGGLDLTALKFDLADAKTFQAWVRVHDRVRDCEMPPKKKAQPAAADVDAFLESIGRPMVEADRAKAAAEGRAVWRRLNRYEYENAVRDLLHAPWLQIKDRLPEDGESHRFNKGGEALDVSHVQMASYLGAADYALREVVAPQAKRPETHVTRYWAREQSSFYRRMKFTQFNRSPERGTFALLGNEAQPDVLTGDAPVTVGASDPAKRELEAMGVVASSYEPIELKFERFTAPASGRYRLRFSAYTFWAGGLDGPKWWTADRTKISRGRTCEPVTIYSETPPRLLRLLGAFDVTPDPSVQELDVYLLAGETIRPDASRLFRSRPRNWHNPLASKEGMPGVAFRWMEVEGPIYDQWPTAGHKLLFGDLPIKDASGESPTPDVVSKDPVADAEKLLRKFMEAAYRRPPQESDVKRILAVVDSAMKSGGSFADAMIAGYTAVLCSPGFVCVEEKPGRLDDWALASRLSFFLWNTAPDAELRRLAAKGELHRPEVLAAQADRLLSDQNSRRFVDAFLDYWLDLRKIVATAPDATLYPDYYLDDLLAESAQAETQLFFQELLAENLPTRNIISSSFAMLNERLAAHYGIPGVRGVALRRVELPSDSVRGGLLTQASVLKVTANGTTTSPVLRGAWVMERILGKPPQPPPPNLPAIDPDIRGATTIRQQLEKHRKLQMCASCHANIDPPGLAMENFDVMGGWRDRYRATGEGQPPPGFGHNGQPFEFHYGPVVDASGDMPDGRHFNDIRDFKKLLLSDEKQVARNLVQQLVLYATGAAARFGDRPEIEGILRRTATSGYGVRSLVREVVLSEMFQTK